MLASRRFHKNRYFKKQIRWVPLLYETLLAKSVYLLVPNKGTIGSGLVRLSVCLSVRLSVCHASMAVGWSQNAWADFVQIWYVGTWLYDLVPFWGFHGGRAKIVAKISPKLYFNGGQLEPKCVDGLYSNLVCICMNPWAKAFWGFHGGRAKIGAKVARNIVAKIVAKISTNVFSSDVM